MKRIAVAVVSLAVGIAVSASLLASTNSSRGAVDAWLAAHDVQTGTVLDAGAISPVKANVGAGASILFTAGENQLVGMRATHDLAAGQLIQRSDVAAADTSVDRRLVFIPIKDVPPVGPGSLVDLLIVAAGQGSPAVEPLALGVQVSSVAPGGLVLTVSSIQASAFVYASATMNLVAVVAEPGAARGAEVPVTTPEQAVQLASQT